MGLLDRVKQNQTVPPAGSTGTGPAATPTLPAAPTYSPQAATPVAQPAATAPPAPAAASRFAVGGDLSPAFTAAKVQIHAKLIEKFADEIDSSNKAGVREKILELAEEYFRSTAMTMTKNDKERLVDSVLDDVLGLGPLEALLADASITEIMANHPKQIYVEKSGEPILSSFTPANERLITCEDAAELQLQQPHWIQLESRPPNVEGKGAVPIRELVKSCLRMRPDRIIVGECRGGEALDMLQAMNTGHDGSMSTLHANNPKEALVRLETLVLQAGQDLPSRAIRETIGSAIHLIVQQSRLRGGIRRIVSVAEITGIKDGDVQFQELFTFKQVGVSAEGKAVGHHPGAGSLPMRMEHLRAEGEDVPEQIFAPAKQPSPDKLY